MIENGNIDLTKRPLVKNADGTVSTVRSMSFNNGRHEVLIPTVHPSGRIMSDDEAIQHHRQTGEHLGRFSTPEKATEYAEKLHGSQESMYKDKIKQLLERKK